MKTDKKKEQDAERNKKTSRSETAGTGKANREPTLRSDTTDSSRMPKKSNDDLPTGGNVR